MDFKTILVLLDKTLRRTFGVEKTNEFLLEFMTRSVDVGSITKLQANKELFLYGCELNETCWGCREEQPNQLAHVEPGGCLYTSPTSDE